MKKRVLSLLMTLALCFTMLPTAAVAEMVGANTAGAYAVGEDTGGQGKQDQQKQDEQKQDEAVQAAQALIDALPEEVTAENAEEIEQQLMALEAALEALTEEQLALLDMTRYEALCAALVSQVSLTAERGGEHADHPICGAAHTDIGDHTGECPVVTWTAWDGTSNIVYDSSNTAYVYLSGNAEREEPLEIRDGHTLYLCLNGHSLTKTTEDSNPSFEGVITIYKGAQFTLCDCRGGGKITHAAGVLGRGVRCGDSSGSATFAMFGGEISGNRVGSTSGAGQDGAGVEVHNGEFILYGGRIADNHVEKISNDGGGGVYAHGSGSFTMYGGEISGNTSAGDGGGVSAVAASFTMKGGSITNNTASAGDGGGAALYNDTFELSGGTITDNSATRNGGGVYMNKNSYTGLTVSGSVTINGNKNAAGADDNVYLTSGNSFVIGAKGLKADAKIGVTYAGTIASGSYVTVARGANKGYTEGNITSDQGSDYTIKREGDDVNLYYGLHEHCICGDMSCTEHENALWTAISSLTNLAPGTENAPSRYYLTEDIELSKTWSAPKYMMLDLNGHTITANGDFDAIKVSGNKTFTLTDCKGTGKITHTDGKTGSGVYVEGSSNTSKAQFIMYGGTITGNAGRSVSIYGSTKICGGGVYVGKYATFDMYGGSITGNTADNGGGVYVGFTGDGEKSYFNMYSGSITDNTATNGGGVYEGNGIFDMSGGSITGNTAQYGGGVNYGGSNGLTVSGNVQITGNKNTSDADDNVYVPIHSTATPPSTPFHISNKGLDASARIGVSIGSTTLAAGGYLPVAWLDTGAVYNEGNFIADNGSGYVFLEEPSEYSTISGNVINLYNGMPHRHPVCGGDTCTGAGHTCDEKVTFKAWSGASGKLPTESGYYYLTDNMTLTTEWEPSEGSNIVLCLNGKTITAKVGTQDSASLTHDSIDIRKGVTVSVTDCVGTGTISRSTYYQRAVNVWGGTFNLYGGKITGFKVDSTSGGGVGIASNGIFNMYGGAITKNTSSYGGGGVHVGYFNSDAGTFNMYGGSITGNTSSRDGAGVRVSRNATMTISGNVKITGNKVGTAANNVYLPRNTTITVTGPLTGGENSIGVTTADRLTKDGSFIAVANGTDSYTLTDNEKNAFSEDDENRFNTKLLRDNTILFTRFVDVQMHDHALCGASCNHETAHSSELWQPLTYYASSQDLYCGPAQANRSTDGRYNADNTTKVSCYFYTLPSGNYYLTEDLTLGGNGSSITGGVLMIEGDVKLCLNGNTLSTTTTAYVVNVIRVNVGGSLTLCDCSTEGSGKITSENKVYTCVQPGGGQNTGKASGKFTMYGGTLTGAYYGVALNDADSVALYGGTITGNTEGVSVNYPVTIGGTVNITGNTNADARLLNKNTGTGLIKIDPSLTQDSHIGVSSEQELSETITSIKIATGATNQALDYTKIFTPDVTDQDYVITKDGAGDLYLTKHTHEWEYTLSEDKATITVTCSNEDGHCPTPEGGSVTLIKPAHTVYGDNKDEKATTSSTLISSIQAPNIVYSQDGTPLYYAPVSAGEYTASITLGGTTASVNYTVEKATLTADDFTYAAPTDLIYDGKTRWPNIDPKVGGVDDYYWSYYDASGNKVSSSGLNVGTYQLHIRVTETENYKAVADLTSADWTFDIRPRQISLSLHQITRSYGEPGFDPESALYIASGTLAPGDTLASLKPSWSSAGVGTADVGTYDVNATWRNTNYSVTFDGVKKLTVTPKPVTVTVDAISRAYGDANPTFTATAPNGALVDRDTVESLGLTLTSEATATSNVGKYNVTGTASNKNYTVTIAGTNKLTVEPKAITVTVDAATRPYGEENPAFTATVPDDALVGSDTLESLGLTLTSAAVETSPVGKYDVTGSASNTNYDVTVVGTDKLTIERKSITVTVDAVSRAYGSDNPTFTATAPSGALVGDDTVESLGLTLTSAAAETSPVGKYDVTGSASSENYTVTIEGADKLTVTPKPVTVTAENKTSRVGYDLVALTYTCTPALIGDDAFTGALTTDANKDVVKDYTITQGTLALNGNYTITFNKGTYTVTSKLTQDDFAFAEDALTRTYGDPDFIAAASGAAEGSTVTYESTDPTVATVDETTGAVHILKVGTTTIKATASETKDYAEKEISYTLKVDPKPVTADMIAAIDDQGYTGSIIQPEPEIKDGDVTLVKGTDFDFSYGANTDAASGGTVTISGRGNYTGTASGTFRILPKSITGAVITLTGDTFDYTGSEQTVTVASVTLDGWTPEITYAIVGGDKATDAGTSTLTIQGTDNYTGTADVTWTINRIAPQLADFDVTPDLAAALVYDGDPKTVAVTAKADIHGMGDVTVKYNGSTERPTDAGSYAVTIDVSDGANYNAGTGIAVGTLTIDKAAAPVLADIPFTCKYTLTGEKTVNAAGLVPGAAGYTLGAAVGDTGIISDASVDANGVVTYTLTGTGKAGDSVTLPVTISSANYADAVVSVVITLSARDDQAAVRVTGGTTVVYGQTLQLGFSGGSGTGKVSYTVVNGTGEATIDANGLLTPVKVGSVTVTATKEGDSDYNAAASAPVEITITKATPTGEPKYTEIKTGGKTLDDAALTLIGSTISLNNGETVSLADGKLEWIDEEGNVLSGSTRVEANKTYKWRFTPTNANYTVLEGETQLYSGSSSGDRYTRYTVQVTVSGNGTVSPSGWVRVREGLDQTFTITPDQGYAVAKVLVDGRSVGAVTSYTLRDVTEDHTIQVIFMKANGNPQTGVDANASERP